MQPQTCVVELNAEELGMILDGLDALEYWELGDRLPRNNGEVFIPGDMLAEHDRYWGDNPEPSDEEQKVIRQVQDCRALAARLRAVPWT